MSIKRPRKRRERELQLSQKFVPKFWQDVDNRLAIVKEIKRRLATLTADAGVDSVQKQILAERVVFLTLKLETAEVEAAETGKFDLGSYTHALNVLAGLLKKLGLEAVEPEARDLEDILQE